MALVDGIWLAQYVEPQLLEDFRNYRDDFIGVLERAPERAIDKDGIRFNKLINNIAFYVNKDTDFNPIVVPFKKNLVEWDKLDTDPTEVTDADLRAMAFDRDSAIRAAHTDSWKIGIRDYAMHKLAPAANVDGKTPVVRTTGAEVDLGGGQSRLRLTYADLITYYSIWEQLNLRDQSKFYGILCAEHRADLLLDRASTQNYRDIEIDKETGAIKRLFKIKFFENNDNPTYAAAGTLVADGAVPTATDRNASTFFYAPNTVYHIEGVKVLHKPMEQDTRSADPTSETRLHSYGLCDKKQDYGFGAIVSGSGA